MAAPAERAAAGRRRHIRAPLVLLLAVTAAALVARALMVAAPAVLTVEHPLPRADVLVVLGGEVEARSARAAELFLAGKAPAVLVTGYAQCRQMRRQLVRAGVPASAIHMECRARSTLENAVFSLPTLHRLEARSAIVVTSWYHTRRALDCFRQAGAGITFGSAAAGHPGDGLARSLVLLEYAKSLWYRLPVGRDCGAAQGAAPGAEGGPFS